MSGLFRNLRIWQLDQPWTLSGEQLAEALEGARFRPCAPGQAETMGWIEVLEDHGLQREISDASVLRVRVQERVVPTKAVAEAVQERAAAIEAREGGPVRGARRRELADEVRAQMLAKAPTQSARHWLIIDRASGLIMIDTATVATCEAILSLLRGSLGSLPLRPLAFTRPIDGVLTQWVRAEVPGDLPQGVTLGDWLDLEHPMDTANKVRFRGQPLNYYEVFPALDRGMRVTALEIIVDVGVEEPVRCVLGEDASLRRVRLPWEMGGNFGEDDAVARLDADLLLVVGGFRHLFERLFPALGGRAAA